MALRRSGSPTAFWNGANVGINALSTKVRIGRDTDQVTIFITNGNGATNTFQPLVAHSGSLTTEGNEPTEDTPPADAAFMPILYAGNGGTATIVTAALGASGTIAIMIPDWTAGWLCLKNLVATSTGVTAGYEAIGT
jgi:hypothetical protein